MAGLNTRADIPAWDSITDGTTLYKGGYVTCAGRYWLCMEKHTKTAQSAPSWWERSPFASAGTGFGIVYWSGSADGSYANGSRGVALGFCV